MCIRDSFKSRIDQYTPSLWRRVGKSGVERIYEEQLRGKHGKRFFLRNARGQKKVEIGKEDFIEGSDLNISINFNAQKKAYDLLNGRKGSIVVIDLRDFSIPVAVSAPSISANDLRDISSKEYQALLNDTKRPLFNRAFMGLYPPGSTIKPFFTIFALSNSYTNWQEQIYDDGFFRFAESGRVFNAWREGGHGLTNLNKALVESSNPFFMNLATRYEKDSFTDFLDGLLARMYKEESKLGELLDPIADKIIVATALILLVMDGTIKNFEVLAAIIILTREILISGLREFLAKGKVNMPVSSLAKLKTFLQMLSLIHI